MNNFSLGETWAGYKDLTVEGQKVAFMYGWQEVQPEYLKQVVDKYPNIFILEDDGGGGKLLKIMNDAAGNLTLKALLDVVENDPMGWFELVDLETKTLINTAKNDEKSVSAESFDD